MVKVLLYIVMLFALVREVNSFDNYLNFAPVTHVSNKDGNIDFLLDYDFDPSLLKEFYIKPVTTFNNAEIFNEKLSSWISENDLLTKMPELKEKISIHFRGFPEETTEIYFQVYRYKTSEVFETPPIKIWGPVFLANYKEVFNSALNKSDNEINKVDITQIKTSKEISEIQPARKYIPIALSLFIISAFFGHAFGNLVKLRSAFG